MGPSTSGTTSPSRRNDARLHRAFEVARREAIKRGFGPDSGRFVQLVTDGDDDLARLGSEYLPHAQHTIDAYHVFEKVWSAAGALFPDGSEAAKEWVAQQKQLLFDDHPEAVLAEFDARLELLPKKGPGNKSKRERLADARRYLAKRLDKIRYGSLRRRDLVLSTDIVEGAIKFVLAKRCDHGGMRWIRERVQAVAQLRCIDVNGDWGAFEAFVHERQHAASLFNNAPARIQRDEPVKLRDVA